MRKIIFKLKILNFKRAKIVLTKTSFNIEPIESLTKMTILKVSLNSRKIFKNFFFIDLFKFPNSFLI